MPVFISYSHQNKEFVTKLASQLVKNNTHVWIDTWELSVGDSLINKIQEAIQTSGALLVVLSEASVKSEWCRKELSVGLVRELSEKKVIVLPLLLDNCNIPLFLQDKVYADFRTSFDDGLNAVLDSIAKIANSNQGRIGESEYDTDWSVDWGYTDELFTLNFTLIEHGKNQPYSVLTQVEVLCNDLATARQQQFEKALVDWFGRKVITEMLVYLHTGEDIKILLKDQFPKCSSARISDPKTNFQFDISVTSRWLGIDTGKSILLNVSEQLNNIRKYMEEVTRKPNPVELEKILQIVCEKGDL